MTRVWVVAALLCAGLPKNAGAQVTAGGTFMFTIQRTPSRVPGTFSPAPGGAAAGVALFGGIEVSRRMGIQGELSIPASMSTTGVSSYSTGDFTDTTRHRDVIISGLVRLGTERRWCDVD
jgi:hypothetical protein